MIEMETTQEQQQAEEIRQECQNLRMQIAEELASGARFSAGLNIHLGDVDEEYVPNLKTLGSRTRIYERMANDPQVRGQLRAIFMTMISGVRWDVEGGEEEDQELVRSNLLREGDPSLWCSSSWLDFVYESLGCLIYGFSLFGKTLKIVDGKTIYSDLTWLHPRSVDDDGWIMDEFDNLLAVKRSYTAPDGTTVSQKETPASDIFLMTWDRRGPNWEGNAFIRPMYRPWMLNEMAEKIDLIDLQNRGVGIPMAHLSGKGGPKERDTLISILKSMRGGSKERQFLVLEQDEKVDYLTASGSARDAGPTMAHHRMNIVKAAGTEYLEAGNTESGSRAASSAMSTGFFVNVDGIRVMLQDMWNNGIGRQPGLVEQLVSMNREGVKKYPKIVGSRVSPQEQLDNIPLLYDGVQKGLIPQTLDLANEALRRLGYPPIKPKEFKEAVGRKTMLPGIGPGRPADAGDDDRGRDDDDSQRLKMQDPAQKKTANSGGNPLSSRGASYPWLKSTQA